MATINDTIDQTVLLGSSNSHYPFSPVYTTPLTIGLQGKIDPLSTQPGVFSNTAGVLLINDGSISGGAGFHSGYTTYFGRNGVQLQAGGTVVNAGAINGGNGGTASGFGVGGAGVYGATEVINTGGIQGGGATTSPGAGVEISNAVLIQTGEGAFMRGGDATADGGYGGTGAFVSGSTSAYNEDFATIAGGSGTTGGVGIGVYDHSTLVNRFGHIQGGASTNGAGKGGIGLSESTYGNVSNQYGTITGGDSVGGTGGTGANLFFGSLTNSLHASITGGNGPTGGQGVQVSNQGALANSGTVTGGSGSTGGTGVYLGGTSSVMNAGTIRGGDSTNGVGGSGAQISGHAVLTTLGNIYAGASGGGGTPGYSVGFVGATSRLVVDPGAHFFGNIGNFKPGDAVDFYGVSVDTLKSEFQAGSASADPTITFASGPGGTLDFQGDRGDTFVFQEEPDGKGAEVVVEDTACYRRGTRIRTINGDVPIEALQVGDQVVTASGLVRVIRWLGHRSLDCRRYADPTAIWPVCVSAGALGEGLPARGLWVSPGHSLSIGGTLVQAVNLINQVTIAQVPCDEIEYWHVELDSHDVLLAEGTAAESYLDTGNRTAFSNGGAFIEAYPDFAPKHWSETCMPLVTEGAALKRACAVIRDRATTLGYRIDRDPHVHITADGHRVDPMEFAESRLAFVLPPGSGTIKLHSRQFVPAHVDPQSDDRRVLGVCIGQLQIDGVEIDLANDEMFSTGWHDVEHANRLQRWTNGAATLPAGARLVVLQMAGRSFFWSQPDSMIAKALRA